jgi:hypothetical protein
MQKLTLCDYVGRLESSPGMPGWNLEYDLLGFLIWECRPRLGLLAEIKLQFLIHNVRVRLI